jgi:SAM-dependent methyltransferase
MNIIRQYFKISNISNLNFFLQKKNYIFFNEIKKKSGSRYDQIKNNIDNYDTYSCSPDTVINILNKLDITSNDSILDIGSGRGYIMALCYTFAFNKIGGVEINERDVNITYDNFKILGINESRAVVYNCDILNFIKYSDYNYFYFYNPFDDKTFDIVIKKIKTNSQNPIIIYLNIHDNDEKILFNNNFSIKYILIDETLNRKCGIYHLQK